jgi:hypothetical protein
MKHIQIYEKFETPYSNEPEVIDPMVVARTKAKEISGVEKPHFEIETENVEDTPGDAAASIIVNFKNSEGVDTVLQLGSPLKPEIVGNTMVSRLEVMPEGNSDGKQYSVIGYFTEVPNTPGAYEVKKALIEEL